MIYDEQAELDAAYCDRCGFHHPQDACEDDESDDEECWICGGPLASDGVCADDNCDASDEL